ncbi:GNAT family N-acetyltransferase [Zooshikella marina]|uniref:GNAT family N-acetyltransferase n=1 Tax=Zooshikella ganghwensis TaxID=202772 RepID=UPI001BAE7F8D|nr:GNAT family N-acetyltransferase [Zooshikella ganghwensis]MBU2706892.1 GNAT family N-acetyltransferase [Zooshikella ganghwensis]
MIFTTERLRLRELTEDDAQSFYQLLADPEVMAYSPSGPLSLEQATKLLTEYQVMYKNYGFGRWAVETRSNSTFIGYSGLAPLAVTGKSTIELIFRLQRDVWQQGYGFEAAKAAVYLAFTRFRLPSIVTLVETDNEAAKAIVKKLGMHSGDTINRWGKEVTCYWLKSLPDCCQGLEELALAKEHSN